MSDEIEIPQFLPFYNRDGRAVIFLYEGEYFIEELRSRGSTTASIFIHTMGAIWAGFRTDGFMIGTDTPPSFLSDVLAAPLGLHGKHYRVAVHVARVRLDPLGNRGPRAQAEAPRGPASATNHFLRNHRGVHNVRDVPHSRRDMKARAEYVAPYVQHPVGPDAQKRKVSKWYWNRVRLSWRDPFRPLFSACFQPQVTKR